MREPGGNGWILRNSSGALTRTLRLAVVAFGIGLVMSAGVARAQDDEEDDKTFEEKIIDNIMAGVGGTNMENRGIDYRERSPLVVPPKLDLPPPETAKSEVKDPNWPKDPDVARRKAAVAARKTRKYETPEQAARILTPSELNVGRTAAPVRTDNDPVQPGVSNNPVLSPSQLGFDGKFSSLFGGSKTESAPFKGEPARQSLVDPPPGYQTPSPNFMYGTGGPKESLNKEYNPAAGKYGE